MREKFKEIIRVFENKNLTFSEPFYISSDKKTIMGELPFKEILFLEYRDTEAGSNPREYNGLKKTNFQILKSLLNDSTNMFRFLHSGIIISLTTDSDSFINKQTIQYEECCLTNGNQTRFIILILFILKLYFENKEISEIKRKDYNDFIKSLSSKTESIQSILKYAKFNKVSELIREILKKDKYKDLFNKLNIKKFLDSRIRAQINVINSMIEDLETELDAYSVGTLIAEANNDTQNVKPDDIFGNKYKNELKNYVFKDFTENYEDIRIEYRYGEIAERPVDKVHILTLLRLMIPIGILKKDKDIYKFTNQRSPIYTVFSKLISKIEKGDKKAIATTKVVSKLIPLLYKIRNDYVIPSLEDRKRELIRKYKEKAYAGELSDSIIARKISDNLSNDREVEKIIKSIVSYNIEHIMPVIIFKIRELFKEEEEELTLNIPNNLRKEYFATISEVIYDKYVEMKLKGLPSSLTTTVRSREFYDFGSESHTTFKRINKAVMLETDFIEKHRYIIN